jgi:hypothetical protein
MATTMAAAGELGEWEHKEDGKVVGKAIDTIKKWAELGAPQRLSAWVRAYR